MRQLFIRFIIGIVSFMIGVAVTLQWFSARQINTSSTSKVTLHSALPQVLSDFQLVGETVQTRWIFPHGTQARPFPQVFEPGQKYILHYTGMNQSDLFGEMFARFSSMGFEVFDAAKPSSEPESGVHFQIGFRDDLYEGYFERYRQTPEEIAQSMLNTKQNFPEANEGEPCGKQDFLLLVIKRQQENVENVVSKPPSVIPEALSNFQLVGETARSRWIPPLNKEGRPLPQKLEAGRQYILQDQRGLGEDNSFEELLSRFRSRNIEVIEADGTNYRDIEGVAFHFGFRDNFYEGYLDRVITPPDYILEYAKHQQRYLPHPVSNDRRALYCYVLVITKTKPAD